MKKIQVVGIVQSLSPNHTTVISLIASMGYQVVVISPDQRIEIDALIIYTDKDPLYLCNASNYSVGTNIDSFLELFISTNTLEFYKELGIPIVGLSKGSCFMKSLFDNAFNVRNNNQLVHSTEILLPDMKNIIEVSVPCPDISLVIKEKAQCLSNININSTKIPISYIHNNKPYYILNLPIEFIGSIVNIILKDLLSSSSLDEDGENMSICPVPPTGPLTQNSKHE